MPPKEANTFQRLRSVSLASPQANASQRPCSVTVTPPLDARFPDLALPRLTGAISRLVDQSLAQHLHGEQQEACLLSSAILGNPPTGVVLTAASAAGFVSSVKAHRQLLMEVSDLLAQRVSDPGVGRVLHGVSVQPSCLLSPGILELFLAQGPMALLDSGHRDSDPPWAAMALLDSGDRDSDPPKEHTKLLPRLVNAMNSHRSSFLMAGQDRVPEAAEDLVANIRTSYQTTMKLDLRSMCLGIIPPCMPTAELDVLYATAHMATEHIAQPCKSRALMDNSVAGAPSMRRPPLETDQEHCRLVHLAWEPVACLAASLSAVELSMHLTATRPCQSLAEITACVVEPPASTQHFERELIRFSKSASGCVLAPQFPSTSGYWGCQAIGHHRAFLQLFRKEPGPKSQASLAVVQAADSKKAPGGCPTGGKDQTTGNPTPEMEEIIGQQASVEDSPYTPAKPNMTKQEVLNLVRGAVKEAMGRTVGYETELIQAGLNLKKQEKLREVLQKQFSGLGLGDIAFHDDLVISHSNPTKIASYICMCLNLTQPPEDLQNRIIEPHLASPESTSVPWPKPDDKAPAHRWCVALATKHLKNQRRGHAHALDVRFTHCPDTLIVEAALVGIGDRHRHSSAVIGAQTGEDALRQLSTGYVVGEGRVFLATKETDHSKSMHNWLKQMQLDMTNDKRWSSLLNSEHLNSYRITSNMTKFSVVGSWSNWTHFEDMEASDRGMYIRVIQVRSGTVEEFQIVQDHNWHAAIYPPAGLCGQNCADTLGPARAHGRNFFVDVPAGGPRRCTISFSPELRRAHWSLSSPVISAPGQDSGVSTPLTGAPDVRQHDSGWNVVGSRAASSSSGGPASKKQTGTEYFLTGSWDGWVEYMQLNPVPGSKASYTTTVPVPKNGSMEFQVVEDRDPSRRFAPTKRIQIRVPLVGGRSVGLVGPSETVRPHWSVQAPPNSKSLRVNLNLVNPKTLRWDFS